jgi:hypothetical protein
MPQLDKITFISQLFWLFLMVFVLYIIVIDVILPKLISIIITREFNLNLVENKAKDVYSSLNDMSFNSILNNSLVSNSVIVNMLTKHNPSLIKRYLVVLEQNSGHIKINTIFINSFKTISASCKLVKEL